MEFIIVCNTAGDTISKISLKDYTTMHLPLELGEKPVGPHSVCIYNEKLITANNYSNSISILDTSNNKEISNIYVGAHPNDIKVVDNYAYIACGESNSIVVMDLISNKILFEIDLAGQPHNICLDEDRGNIYVCNLEGSSISIVDCKENKVIDQIKTLEYPTKCLLSNDKKMLYICESFIGHDVEGYIKVISIEEGYKVIKKIKVGMAPVDLWEENGRIYVTNFSEGSISIVDISKGREVKKIFIGGMPRGIIKFKENIFVGDNFGGLVKVLNLKEQKIKNIAVGKEPNAMIII